VQRRSGKTESPGSAAPWYTSESFSPDEMHQARLVMILFGLIFLGACVAYVVMAAGQILG
jgi:hypothetical protein